MSATDRSVLFVRFPHIRQKAALGLAAGCFAEGMAVGMVEMPCVGHADTIGDFGDRQIGFGSEE